MAFHTILLIRETYYLLEKKKLQGSLYFIFLALKVCPVIGRKLSWFYDLSALVFQSLACKTMA